MSLRGVVGPALCALALAIAPLAAAAKTVVTLTLSGAHVQVNGDGTTELVPLEREAARPGERIRWQLTALNAGDQPARGLVAVGRIPAGTRFIAGSAPNAGARVEYSLDGGRTWSANPTVVEQTPSGRVVRKADPSRYTMIRWIAAAPLAAGATSRFSYEVTVR